MISKYAIALLLLLFINSFSQDSLWLNGKLTTIKNNVAVPIKNTVVIINETKDRDKTDNNGFFRIKLRNDLVAGDKISVSVEKEKWAIQYPLNGELYIPKEFEKQLVKIQILPSGSKLFLSNDHLEKLIEDFLQKTTQLKLVNQPNNKEDLPEKLQDWATKFGFTIDDVKLKLDEWIRKTESRKEDGYKLGLATFAKKEYAKAGKIFNLNAKEAELNLFKSSNEIENLVQQNEKFIEIIIDNYQNEAQSFYEIERFDLAIIAYNNTLKYVKKVNKPNLWIDLNMNKTSALYYQSRNITGIDLLRNIDLAIEICDTLLLFNNKYIDSNLIKINKGTLLLHKVNNLKNNYAIQNSKLGLSILQNVLQYYQTQNDEYEIDIIKTNLLAGNGALAINSDIDSIFYYLRNAFVLGSSSFKSFEQNDWENTIYKKN